MVAKSIGSSSGLEMKTYQACTWTNIEQVYAA